MAKVTIEEAQILGGLLEAAILEKIQLYEKTTGVHVENVNLYEEHSVGSKAPQVYSVVIDFKI